MQDAASAYAASKLRSLASAELRDDFERLRDKATRLADASGRSGPDVEAALQTAADALLAARGAVASYAGSSGGEADTARGHDSLGAGEGGVSLARARSLIASTEQALRTAATALLESSRPGDSSSVPAPHRPGAQQPGPDRQAESGGERYGEDDPHAANIEHLRGRLLAAADALRSARQRQRLEPKRVTSAIALVSAAGTALFEYQAANSFRGGARSGTDVASFSTRATQELLVAEAAVRDVGKRPVPAARTRATVVERHRQDVTRRDALEASSFRGDGDEQSSATGPGPRDLTRASSASVLSHRHDPRKLAEWARDGKYDRIMAAARESTWSEVGVETGRSVAGSTASRHSAGGRTMMETLRTMKHTAVRDRNARRATEARLASTGESRFQRRERDVGDPRTLQEAVLGSEGLSTLRGSSRLVDKFSLQSEAAPTLLDGKVAWEATAEGAARSRESHAEAYKATFVTLGDSAGVASGLDLGGAAGGLSSCRSESLWAAAGVPVRLADVARSPRPAWGRPRSHVSADDAERWAEHTPERVRSSSRERSRASAGINGQASSMRRALRAERLKKSAGGMFVGEAAEAFELLLAETLGGSVTNDDSLRVSRGRSRLERHLRTSSPSRRSRSVASSRGSLTDPITPIRGPRSAQAGAPGSTATSPGGRRESDSKEAWASALSSPARAASADPRTDAERIQSLMELAGSPVAALRESSLPSPTR